jgi:Tol biopolymer transport system component
MHKELPRLTASIRKRKAMSPRKNDLLTLLIALALLLPGGTQLTAAQSQTTEPPAVSAASGTTARVSVASDGTQGERSSYHPGISANGRYGGFISPAHNLVSGDTSDYNDVFVHDRQAAQTTRVSVSSNGTPGNDDSVNTNPPSLSADGRFVAFESLATNLVSGDTNGALDVFLRNRQTGQTSRDSVSSGGAQGNDF